MDKFYKKYIWDDQRTPYFVPTAKLTRGQAEYELHFYALATGILFAVIALASLSNRLPHGAAQGVSLFAFSQVCAAVLLGIARSIGAAVYCSSAPIAGLAYFAAYGFHANLGTADKVLLVLAMVLWLWYCRRLIAVTRVYEKLDGASGAG